MSVMSGSRGFSEQGIRGVLLPAGQRYILLPNAAVAEMIFFKNPTPHQDLPVWVLGRLDWRGINIPVISWERLIENRDPNLENRRLNRIAVLNTLNGNPAVTHIGLVSVGVARITRIRADIMTEDKTETVISPLIKSCVTISGIPAWIPDLDELEKLVASLPNH